MGLWFDATEDGGVVTIGILFGVPTSVEQVLNAALRRTPTAVAIRRCRDADELLAAAGAGLGTVVVCTPDLKGLGVEETFALQEMGMRVVVLVAPERGDMSQIYQLGADHIVLLPRTVVGAEKLLAMVGEWESATDPLRVYESAESSFGLVPRSGAVVVVWGSSGAPGRSTVAANLAAILAEISRNALLVDADTRGMSQRQMFGVDTEDRGLLQAVKLAEIGKLDSNGLRQLLTVPAAGLSILTGVSARGSWVELGPVALSDLWQRCRQLFTWTVVDVGEITDDGVCDRNLSMRNPNSVVLSALQEADLVLAVGRPDEIGMARLSRDVLELDLVPQTPKIVVLNQVRYENRPLLPGVGEQELTWFAHPVQVLPYDLVAVDQMRLRHSPVSMAAPGSALHLATIELARLLVDVFENQITR